MNTLVQDAALTDFHRCKGASTSGTTTTEG